MAAVVLLASMTFRLLGFESILYNNGVDLNLQALLVFCALLGFGGSFVSLLMSKFAAKRAMRVQVIEQPRNQQEQWLVSTVEQLSHRTNKDQIGRQEDRDQQEEEEGAIVRRLQHLRGHSEVTDHRHLGVAVDRAIGPIEFAGEHPLVHGYPDRIGKDAG